MAAKLFTFELLFETYGREVTEDDREELKKNEKFYSKVMHEEDIRSDQSIPDTDDDDEQDFDEIKDPRQAQDAAAADAVNKVLEEIIQLPASKKICDAHHLDQEILTKVLENLKNSITQETSNQLSKRRRQLAEDNEMPALPIPLQAPPHDKVNNVSEETASKKIRYAHDEDEDEEIRSKVSEERV